MNPSCLLSLQVTIKLPLPILIASWLLVAVLTLAVLWGVVSIAEDWSTKHRRHIPWYEAARR